MLDISALINEIHDGMDTPKIEAIRITQSYPSEGITEEELYVVGGLVSEGRQCTQITKGDDAGTFNLRCVCSDGTPDHGFTIRPSSNDAVTVSYMSPDADESELVFGRFVEEKEGELSPVVFLSHYGVWVWRDEQGVLYAEEYDESVVDSINLREGQYSVIMNVESTGMVEFAAGTMDEQSANELSSGLNSMRQQNDVTYAAVKLPFAVDQF